MHKKLKLKICLAFKINYNISVLFKIMQKVKLPEKISTVSKDGIPCIVKISWKLKVKYITARYLYGFINLTMDEKSYFDGSYLTKIQKAIDNLPKSKLRKMKYTEMLNWKEKKIYHFGELKGITNDAIYKFDKNHFYYSSVNKFTDEFDEQLLKYIRNRIKDICFNNSIQLDNKFQTRIIHNLSRYAYLQYNGFVFSFDRRLGAYKPIVIDSVICHEICHIQNANHGKEFYQQLDKIYGIKRYKESRNILAEGRFLDEPKN